MRSAKLSAKYCSNSISKNIHVKIITIVGDRMAMKDKKAELKEVENLLKIFIEIEIDEEE